MTLDEIVAAMRKRRIAGSHLRRSLDYPMWNSKNKTPLGRRRGLVGEMR
jgi:hypothetical protein